MSAAALGAAVLAQVGGAGLIPAALAVAVLSAALLCPLAPERWAGRVRGD
jgi:hypothetical protein